MNSKSLTTRLFTSAGILFLSLVASSVLEVNGQAKQPLGFDPASVVAPATSAENDVDAIEKIVRNYLMKNPAVIREAMQALQAQETKEKQERAANQMKELRSEILFDPGSPVAGNAKGDISIVVFFDYNCGYCKHTLPQLQSVSRNDPLVRIVYKEFPVLGPKSTFAAKAALAAARQGKYVEFHDALMTAEVIDEVSIKSISKTLGIDHSKLQKDMADPEIDEQITRNQRLAESLEISGTPAYVVGDQMIPGAIDAETLTRFVQNERNKAKEPKK